MCGPVQSPLKWHHCWEDNRSAQISKVTWGEITRWPAVTLKRPAPPCRPVSWAQPRSSQGHRCGFPSHRVPKSRRDLPGAAQVVKLAPETQCGNTQQPRLICSGKRQGTVTFTETVHSKIQNMFFLILTRGAFYPSRLFWCESLSLRLMSHGDVCISLIQLN